MSRPCGCGKRRERLAAKRAVTASAASEQQQQMRPNVWTGKKKEKG